MPYIKKEDRKDLDKHIKKLGKIIAERNIANCTCICGDLNYTVTKLIKETLKAENVEKSYAQLNEIIGMLESCKLEFYRREVAPYEDKKIKENSDVY